MSAEESADFTSGGGGKGPRATDPQPRVGMASRVASRKLPVQSSVQFLRLSPRFVQHSRAIHPNFIGACFHS